MMLVLNGAGAKSTEYSLRDDSGDLCLLTLNIDPANAYRTRIKRRCSHNGMIHACSGASRVSHAAWPQLTTQIECLN